MSEEAIGPGDRIGPENMAFVGDLEDSGYSAEHDWEPLRALGRVLTYT